MFLEYFQQLDAITKTLQKTILPGTKVYQFAIHSALEISFPTHINKHILREVLFCTKGSFTFQYEKCRPCIIQKGEILFLSGEMQAALQFSVQAEGILVVFEETEQEREEQTPFFSILTKQCETESQTEKKICLPQNHMWSQSVFMVLDILSEETRMTYCIWKAVELQFLLQNGLVFQEPQYGYMTVRIGRIHDYMKEHLDEKLTIARISEKFNLSPTTLKTTFRSLYGQSIHQWLQVQRMERAAELLHTTPMSILQVAQDVGYEGLSQFNVVFKKRYGMTPGQYRKMSNTGGF